MLSADEVAEILGVSASWVRDHAAGPPVAETACREIGVLRWEGALEFLVGDIENFIQQQRTT